MLIFMLAAAMTIAMLIATFIALPLLPNEPIDPWGALNPYKLWLLVILISSLSLVGYVATRLLGSGRGALLTGLTGGLVSSTAVTLSFSKEAREQPKNAPAFAVSVVANSLQQIEPGAPTRSAPRCVFGCQIESTAPVGSLKAAIRPKSITSNG